MITTSHVLLDVQQAATELHATPLAIKRLIARERLPATLLAGDDWRISTADLADARDAAGDLRLPKLAGVWFDQQARPLARQFVDAIISAAQDQRLNDRQAAVLAQYNPGARSIDVELSVTPALQQVLNRPVPVHAFNRGQADEHSRFARLADLYLAEKLRDGARKIVDQQMQSRPPLEKLYASPQQYYKLIGRAVGQTSSQGISFSEQRTVGSTSLGVRFFYVLQHGRFADASKMLQIAELAF